MTRQAVGEISIPIHCRPKFCAATTAVPQPQKASRTMSFSLLLRRIILSSSDNGFCVGYPRRSLEEAWMYLMSSHQVVSGTPLASSRYRLYIGTTPGRICTTPPSFPWCNANTESHPEIHTWRSLLRHRRDPGDCLASIGVHLTCPPSL